MRRKNKHIESGIQKACVRWFRIQYCQYAKLLFAVPNGGLRNAIEAAIMQDEGVVPGVSDLILLISRNGYTSLCIEMKRADGKQTKFQKEWQLLVEKNGSKYVICRCFDDFFKTVNEYLK